MRYYRSGLAGLYALAGIMAPQTLAAQTSALPRHFDGIALPAPYQIAGVESRAEQAVFAKEDAPFGSSHIIIDLGEAEGRPPPAYEAFQTWTIIGEKGWAPAVKINIQKRCDYLCGGEGESCYYVAIVALTDPIADIGAPLAAMDGAYALSDFSPAAAKPLETIPLASSDQYTGLFENEDYRVVSSSANNLTLAFRWRNEHNEHVYEVEASDCTANAHENLGLENTQCNAVSILSGSGIPLIASYADYNSSKTTPLVAFEYGGSRYYAIRYGAKAQDIIGLVAAAPQGWRDRFRGRDHALLC